MNAKSRLRLLIAEMDMDLEENDKFISKKLITELEAKEFEEMVRLRLARRRAETIEILKELPIEIQLEFRTFIDRMDLGLE